MRIAGWGCAGGLAWRAGTDAVIQAALPAPMLCGTAGKRPWSRMGNGRPQVPNAEGMCRRRRVALCPALRWILWRWDGPDPKIGVDVFAVPLFPVRRCVSVGPLVIWFAIPGRARGPAGAGRARLWHRSPHGRPGGNAPRVEGRPRSSRRVSLLLELRQLGAPARPSPARAVNGGPWTVDRGP
jgi:hypothetical protein